MRRKKIRKVLWTLLALFGVYLGACFALSGKYLSPRRKVADKPADMVVAEWGGQECFVTARLARGERVPVVFVLAHGLGGNRGAFVETAETLDRAGYGAILPPMSGQDVNPEPTVGFGVKEADLIVRIAEEARALPQGPKVIIGGVSMGGAGAWLATKKLPWISGVITESAYTDMPRATDRFLGRLFPGAVYLLKPVVWFGSLRSGIAIETIRPVDAAKEWRGPAVVIHAGDDGLFPVEMGEELAGATGTKLEIFPRAGHSLSRTVAPERYDRLFLNLAERALGKNAPSRSQ